MQITLERQSKAIALSFNTDNSIAYEELYLAVQDKMSGIVNGGKFLAGVVGKAFTIIGNAVSVLSKNIYVQAAAGGLGSRLAGGSFELGFLTAGLAFAVNQVVTELAQQTTSEAGLKAIAEHEGFRGSVYDDLAGHPTIGYGHKLTAAEIKSGVFANGITEDQGMALLGQDLTVAETAVRNSVNVSLTQNQFDALVSFTFNVGGGNLRSSTLVSQLNAGNYSGAADQFLRWNKVRINGQLTPSRGLSNRRSAERCMFLGGC